MEAPQGQEERRQRERGVGCLRLVLSCFSCLCQAGCFSFLLSLITLLFCLFFPRCLLNYALDKCVVQEAQQLLPTEPLLPHPSRTGPPALSRRLPSTARSSYRRITNQCRCVLEPLGGVSVCRCPGKGGGCALCEVTGLVVDTGHLEWGYRASG